MIDCMNDEQDSSEDERCFFFLRFAAAGLFSAWAFGSFDFSLNSLAVWEFGSFDRIQGRRIAAGIE